jgi:hypothetical protein
MNHLQKTVADQCCMASQACCIPRRLFTSLAAIGVYVRLEVPLSVDTVSYKRYSDSYDYSVFGIFITTGFSLAVNLLTLLSLLY